MSLKHWLIEVRVPFLLLPLVLSLVGGVLAYSEGSFDPLTFAAFTAVLVLLHITVNTLNEYKDDSTGIDHNQRHRSVFNGGTGMIQAGFVRPKDVLAVSLSCATIALALGLWVVWVAGLILLPLLALGMTFALLYTHIFARRMLGEVAAGLGLGFLPVLGAYMVQTGGISSGCLVLATAAGLLTFNLLLLNEFPDTEADRNGGRRNIVLRFGLSKAAWIYTLLNAAVYLMLLVFAVLGTIPALSALGLLTVPLAYQAASSALHWTESTSVFASGLKKNVMVVLVTQILIVVGIFSSILL
ncbi:MAG: prenyltransferase [Methanomassiliicoccales archaeon]|nr:prenyltransferase [Methanomassiliicoccales archaeon]